MEHAGRHQSDQLRSCDRGPTGNGIDESAGPDGSRLDEVARHLRRTADVEAQRPHMASSDGGGDPPGIVDRGRRGQPDVVGHQHRPGPDRTPARGGMGRPQVGGLPPDLGQRPLRAVDQTGQAQFGQAPGREPVPGQQGVGHGRPGQRHERDHVDHADPGVHALMGTDVQPFNRGRRHRPGCCLHLGTGQRQHRPVVVHVRVHVEQRTAGRDNERRHLPPLTDIDHALQQPACPGGIVNLRHFGCVAGGIDPPHCPARQRIGRVAARDGPQ